MTLQSREQCLDEQILRLGLSPAGAESPGRGPAMCTLSSLPGNSDAHSTLTTTVPGDVNHGMIQRVTNGNHKQGKQMTQNPLAGALLKLAKTGPRVQMAVEHSGKFCTEEWPHHYTERGKERTDLVGPTEPKGLQFHGSIQPSERGFPLWLEGGRRGRTPPCGGQRKESVLVGGSPPRLL